MLAANVGTVDRILRLIVGAALLAFALFGPADITWKWVGFIGVVPIATALLRSCPLYTLLGLSTCPRKAA